MLKIILIQNYRGVIYYVCFYCGRKQWQLKKIGYNIYNKLKQNNLLSKMFTRTAKDSIFGRVCATCYSNLYQAVDNIKCTTNRTIY